MDFSKRFHTIWVGLCLLLAQPLSAQLNYTNEAEARGIEHSYLSFLNGGGISFVDFDQDGWDDLTLATEEGEPLQFYRNNEGTFELLDPLVDNDDEVKQILWADFDNDGDQDLFLATYYGLNRLYEQTDSLVFNDITLAAGLPSFNTQSFGAAYGDYDRDGWLDLYFNVRIQGGADRHFMFRNNGDGTFIDQSDETATRDDTGRPFCSSFLDYNNDGWPDLYTAHDREANTNTLLKNTGQGFFVDISTAAGADLGIEAMCVNTGDYNNDGLFDLYVTNNASGNKLLRNTGPNTDGFYTYEEVATESGAAFFGFSWGSVWLDADNDGDLDLYISGSSIGAEAQSAGLLLNEADGTFSEPNLGFAGDTVRSYNNAIGDLDHDGYPDIMVVNVFPFSSQLWRSDSLENHWSKFQLQGTFSNRDAIGARITCYVDSITQYRYTQCGNGFLGQNSQTVHFGLAQHTLIDSLLVQWPNGLEERYYSLSANTHYLLVEGDANGETPPLYDPTAEPDDPISSTTVFSTSPLWLYPQPARNQLNIQYPNMALFRITNANGQTIQTGILHPGNNTIPVANLPAGNYFLQTHSPGTSELKTVPWVKQ